MNARYYVKAETAKGKVTGYGVYDCISDLESRHALFSCKVYSVDVALHLANTLRDDMNRVNTSVELESRVIFKSAHYTACAMKDGSLVVTRNRGQSGTRIAPGAAAKAWAFNIETAIDHQVACALCRAVIRSGTSLW